MFVRCIIYQLFTHCCCIVTDNPRPFTDIVSVFIDNSNILSEGKYTVGRIEHAPYDPRRRSGYIDDLKIDYGRLLSRALCGREMSDNPTIVGTRPDDQDSLWKSNYEVTFYEIKKEKKNYLTLTNSTLVIAGMNAIHEKEPGTMVIISSDDSYNLLAKEALRRGWKVETWSWMKGKKKIFAFRVFGS